jgi:hypothetical protein
MTADDRSIPPSWHGSVLLFVFVILFVALRSLDVWLNPRVGLVLGALFASGLFFQLWEQDETTWLDNIPGRIYVLGGIALSLLGGGMLVHVLQGGTSDDAVATLVLLAFAASGILVCHRPSARNEKREQNRR